MADLNLKIRLQALDRASKQFKNIKNAGGKLGKSFDENRKKLAALQKTLDNVQAFKKSKSALEENGRALTDMREKAARLQQQLNDTSGANRTARETERMRREFARARNSIERLERTQQTTIRRTGTLRDRLRSAGISTRNLDSSTRTLQRDAATLNQTLTTQSQKLQRLAERERRVNQIRERGRKLLGKTAVAGAAGTAAGYTGYRAASGIGRLLAPGFEFGFQSDRAAALSNVAKGSDNYKMLRKQAMDLGASTQYHAVDVAKGQQFLAMAGFTPESIKAAMPSVLNLATVGNIDLATTSDIASNILSGFKLPAQDMTKVADVMAATITKTNVDVQMLGDTMKYVAPAAHSVGASLQETAAMAGLLGNVGIQGTMAGTALRSLYNRMASPPKEAKTALKELSIQTKDANGNLRAMPDILADVARKTEHMGNAKRLGYFTDIAGTYAGTAMNELVQQAGIGAITKFSGQLGNVKGYSKKLSKEMYDNAYGDLIKLGSAWEAFQIQLFSTSDSPIRNLLQGVTKLIDKFSAWTKANPKLAGTILKVLAGMAGLVTVGGALLAGASAIIVPIVLLTGALSALSIAAGAISLPFLLIIGVIALLGYGLYKLYQHWDDVKSYLIGSWTSFKDWLSNIVTRIADTLKSVWSDAVDWVQTKWSAFTDWISNIGTRIIDNIKSWNIFGAIKGVFKGAIDWVDAKLQWMIQTFEKVKAAFSSSDKWTSDKETVNKLTNTSFLTHEQKQYLYDPKVLFPTQPMGTTPIIKSTSPTISPTIQPIAGNSATNTTHNEINVTVQGNADNATAQHVAKVVSQELDKRERKKSNNAAFYDTSPAY